MLIELIDEIIDQPPTILLQQHSSQACHRLVVDLNAHPQVIQSLADHSCHPNDIAGIYLWIDMLLHRGACNRNMSKSKGSTLQSSLLMLWMDENSNQQSNKNC